MRKLKLFFYLIIITLFLSSLTSCSYSKNNCDINTNLQISSSGSGAREISLNIPENILKNEENKTTFKNIISSNCPKQLSYVESESENSLCYVFYLNFNSFDDYKTKVNSILGFDSGIVYSNQDNLFIKNTTWCENFSSLELLNWLKINLKTSNIKDFSGINFKCKDTFINLNGNEYRSDNYINLSLANGSAVDEITINTQNNNDLLFDRTFDFKVPLSTIEKLGQENIRAYFSARAAGCDNFSIQSYKSGNEYVIEYKNISTDKMNEYTSSLFNSNFSENINYHRSNDYISLFTNENSFDETLDLSSYCGKNNSNVNLKYNYFINQDNMNKLFKSQNYFKGNWENPTEFDDNHAQFNLSSPCARINISNGKMYEFSKVKIKLNILGDNYFSKDFDFYFDKSLAYEAASNIDLYLKNKNSLFSLENINQNGENICRLEFKGNNEEITREEIKLFGEENSLTISKNNGKFYDIHKIDSIVDTFDLTRVISENNLTKELTYQVDSSQGYIGSMYYKNDKVNSKKINIKQTSNKDICFNPKSYKSEVSINSFTTNYFGVFILFSICIIFIFMIIFLIFKFKKGNLKIPKIKLIKNSNNKTKKLKQKEIDDILKDI